MPISDNSELYLLWRVLDAAEDLLEHYDELSPTGLADDAFKDLVGAVRNYYEGDQQ